MGYSFSLLDDGQAASSKSTRRQLSPAARRVRRQSDVQHSTVVILIEKNENCQEQIRHSWAPASEYVPAAQAWHAALLTVLYVPAEHERQSVAPMTRPPELQAAVKWPAPQEIQVV